jgi:hypothetical protein
MSVVGGIHSSGSEKDRTISDNVSVTQGSQKQDA